MSSSTDAIPTTPKSLAPRSVHLDPSCALASAPETDPVTLVALSKDPVEAIRQAVARNPNTPLQTLYTLWDACPEAYLQNPIRDYWALTQSEPRPKEWPQAVRWSIYQYLVQNAKFNDLTAFMSERERGDLASGYPGHGPFKGRPQILLLDPSEAVRLKVLIFYRYVSGKEDALHCIPEATFLKVATDPSVKVREALAELPYTAPSARLILARDPAPSIRLALARNRDFKRGAWMTRVWGLLALDESSEVKIALSRHPEIDARLIAKLAMDSEVIVRCAAASSSAIDAATLETLAEDSAKEVQVAVASNEKTSPSLLDNLARRKLAAIQEAVLTNASAEIETLESILQEGAVPDQTSLLQNRRFRSKWVDRLWPLLDASVRSGLASRSGNPAEILLRLAEDPALEVRLSLTRRLLHPKFRHTTPTNYELVDRLTHDPAPEVRMRILTDHRISAQRFVALAQDPSPDVRSAFALQASDTFLEPLVALCHDEAALVRHSAARHLLWKLEFYRRYHFYDSYRSLYAMARNALTTLASDKARTIRTLLAKHAETPPAALDILFCSNDPKISKTVSEQKRFPYGAALDFTLDRSWPRKLKAPRTGTRCTPSADALEVYAMRRNRFLRLLTARYHRTRISTLRRLANDPESLVAAAAKANLKRKLKQ